MVKDIASVSFVDETNALKKITMVADTCFPNDVLNGYPCKVVQGLASTEKLSALDHGSIIIEMDKETYEFHKSIADKQDGIQAPEANSPLKFTSYNKRYLVSGSVRGWIELANASILMKPMNDTGKTSIEHIVDNILADAPNFASTGIRGLVNPAYLTEKERMVHEYATFQFTVSRDIAYTLVQIKGARITDAPIPDRMMEPLFFADHDEEVAMDKDMEASRLWDNIMTNASKAYENLIELGVSSEDASSVLPGSRGMTVFVTMNLYGWKRALTKFAAADTYYGIMEVMIPIMEIMKKQYPFMFD